MSDKPRRKAAAKPPVSAHPAFPVIVALWFAALLGIGTLVLPVALFESLSEASGLSQLVVAAQAPLGVTARILIALTAAGAGAVVGLAIARQVIAAGAPRAAGHGEAGAAGRAPAKRPLSVHDDLGEDGIEPPQPEFGRSRRRALAVNDESARSDFLEIAPLPGHAAVAREQEPGVDSDEVSTEESAHEPIDEPLELGAFDCAGPDETPEPAESARRFEPEEAFGTSALSNPPTGEATYVPQAAGPAEFAPTANAAADESEDRSMMQRPLAAFDDGIKATPAVADAPFAEASNGIAIVDLVDRFARALQDHREQAAAVAAESLSDPVVDLTLALSAKPAAEPKAEPEPAPRVPAALRPFDFDEFGDDADDEDFCLPPLSLSLPSEPVERPFAETSGVIAGEFDEDGGEDADEEGYSSLLAMKSSFGLPREPVRIEEEDDDASDEAEGSAGEPVVIFPGQATARSAPGPAPVPLQLRPFDAPQARLEAVAKGAVPTVTYNSPARPAASSDTERALREALEKLQKMSGAA